MSVLTTSPGSIRGDLDAAAVLAHGNGTGLGGSAAAGWSSFFVLLGAFLLVVACLVIAGGSREDDPRALVPLLRAADALERLTGFAGWAAVTVGTSLFGLLVAGVGFYRDVAYHIAYGRDEVLFTAPHTEIFVGLCLILLAPLLGIAVATARGVDVGRRVGRFVVPWSALPLLGLGLGAVAGFPIDEIWHQAFGVDVTMWSPPHLMMILGASFSGAASWLVLAEARVPRIGWGRTTHALCAAFTLLGLNAPLAEFAFGVPQWQHLYHPVILMISGGIALVATRIVLGRGSAVLVSLAVLGIGLLRAADLLPGVPVELRQAGLYVGSAAVVEVVALLTRSPRFLALWSGVGIATVGLATEWLWNLGAYQPWRTALLPEAFLVGGVAALAAVVLGATLGRVIAGGDPGFPPVALGLAGVGVIVALAIPFPRTDSPVHGELTVEDAGPDAVTVQVRTDPPVDDARWFQALAWQGGDRVIAPLEPVGDGVYRAARPIPVDGFNKSMVRLQRGAEMVAIPVRFPEDPEIGAPEVPAEDRSMLFTDESEFLLREVALHDAGPAWLRTAVSAVFGLIVIFWGIAFVLATSRIVPGAAGERRMRSAARST